MHVRQLRSLILLKKKTYCPRLLISSMNDLRLWKSFCVAQKVNILLSDGSSLAASELKMLACQLKEDQRAAATIKKHYQEHGLQPALQIQIGEQAFFFWHCFVNQKRTGQKLPDAFTSGIESAVRHGFTVKLYMYCKLEELPPGVTWCDATEIWPWPAALELIGRGWKAQHIADLIRILAIKKSLDQEDAAAGWFVDGDTLWLKSVSALQLLPNTYGHVIGSMLAAHKLGKTKID